MQPNNSAHRLQLLAAVLAGVPAMFAGCDCRSCSSTGGAAASASASASASAAPKRKRSTHLRPLPGAAQRHLDVPGTRGAEVEVPVGSTDSRPVLIVLSDGQPEASCSAWRGVSQGYGFVLCPRLTAMDSGSAPDFATTEKTLRGSLRVLRRVFGDRISPGPVVLVGQGTAASLAPRLVKQEPAYFERLALVDGGFPEWSSGLATIFSKQGGKRALFFCSRPGCATPARDAAVLTQRAGARARSASAADGGAARLPPRPLFEWLIEDDSDWKPPRPAAR